MAKAILGHEDLRKTLRSKRRGRTMRDLADEIGISHGYLCDILNGKREAGPRVLAYLKLERHHHITYRKVAR